MNKLTVTPFANPDSMFKPTFIAVQGIVDGNPATIAAIFHNKHGRHNLVPVGGHGFYAGSRNLSLLKKYAKDFDPQHGVHLDKVYGGYTVSYVKGPREGERVFCPSK